MPLLNTPMIQARYQGRKILRYAVKFALSKGEDRKEGGEAPLLKLFPPSSPY
jgi:hypothetical protein